MALNPIEQIRPVTIVGMITVFWVTFAALKRVFYGPVLEVMVRRRQKIADATEKVTEADALVASARQEAERILQEADTQVDKIGREAAEEVETERQEKLVAAKEEADQLLKDGRTRVGEVRKQEEAKVRSELVGCTTIACNKLVGKIDPRLIESVVDKVMRARLAV